MDGAEDPVESDRDRGGDPACWAHLFADPDDPDDPAHPDGCPPGHDDRSSSRDRPPPDAGHPSPHP